MATIAIPQASTHSTINGRKLLFMLTLGIISLVAWQSLTIEWQKQPVLITTEDGLLLTTESGQALRAEPDQARFRIVTNWRKAPLTPWM